jgi:hypothetical protein
MEDNFSQTENSNGRVVCIGSYKERTKRNYRKKNGVRVQIEVSCSQPVGEDIKKGLTGELGKLDGVVVVDRGPDWVFSIIAFHSGGLVELSVILRQFFRAGKPGTEGGAGTPSDEKTLRPGAWVYESLRFHGLFGVRVADLKGLLGSLAEEFGKNHLLKAPKRELRGLHNDILPPGLSPLIE